MRRTNYHESSIKTLERYLQFGLALMLTTAFAFLKVPRFSELLGNDLYHGILAIGLFIMTCLWFGGWIYFDHRELELIDIYITLEPRKVRIRTVAPFISMIFIGLFSGILLAISDQVRFYLPLTIFNLFVGAIGYSQVYKNVSVIYHSPDREVKGVAELICDYYLKRPFYTLDFAAIAALVVALMMAWYAWLENQVGFMYGSYLITIITIGLHESILWKWRIDRDRKIEEIEIREEPAEQAQSSAPAGN